MRPKVRAECCIAIHTKSIVQVLSAAQGSSALLLKVAGPSAATQEHFPGAGVADSGRYCTR